MRNRIIFIFSAALIAASLYACGGTSTPPAAAPTGDPTKGQALFQRGCASCHNTSTQKLVGPGLAGLFEPGGPTLSDGVDYGGNLPNGRPITEANVAAWIKAGGQGKIGVMPAKGVAPDITDQDITNIVAYLKTLKK
ncbi:MAG: cytochrome c [Chloroflexi bacterium SZAS-1]|jgi:cytochrome c|nr:cytochrome c [Chloroflexi bacterium SZAS-1]HNP88932.1 cytochrome c [Kouleothrix sp.]